MPADRAVHRIGIGEVIRRGDGQAVELPARQFRQQRPQMGDQPVGGLAVHALIVVARVVIAAVVGPVRGDDVPDALAAGGEDVEPEQHRPEAVLLAHMVRAGAGALLAADRGKPGVEQVAEEFPAGRGLEEADAELFRHPVGRAGGRHRAGDALEARGITGGEMGIGSEQREAVGGRHEDAAPDDEVAVAVAVRGRAKIRRIRAHQLVVEFLRMDEVRVRVVAAEIGQGGAIPDRPRRGTEPALEDLRGIGTGHGGHRVK